MLGREGCNFHRICMTQSCHGPLAKARERPNRERLRRISGRSPKVFDTLGHLEGQKAISDDSFTFWSRLGSILVLFGFVLGCLGPVVGGSGSSWSSLGRGEPVLGASWAILGPFRAVLVPSGTIHIFSRCAKMLTKKQFCMTQSCHGPLAKARERPNRERLRRISGRSPKVFDTLGHLEGQKAISDDSFTFWSRLGSILVLFGFVLGCLGPVVGGSGSSWSSLGRGEPVLGASWAILGPFRAVLVPSGAILGAIFDHLRAILGNLAPAGGERPN